MATLYNLEPQPTAKVVLHTTAGDILLELFAQQTPLTSRNFLQHCLDGYYDNTIFHRVVPGFILQGGDPTGTGSGGESTFEHGAPFADEFHSRLKFNRRGLLGMANGGGRDDNGSQFFLTLGKTEELTGRNTMFGRVEGNTIFNLVKMGEADMTEEEGSERPLYPTQITGAEILVNPFEDMVKRVKVATRATEKAQPKKKTAASKKKGGKSLLSFGGGEEDGEDGLVPIKAAKFNPKLVDTASTKEPSSAAAPKRPAPPSAPTSEPAPKRRVTSPSPSLASKAAPKVSTRQSVSPSPSPSPPPQPRSEALLSQANAQIAALKASLRRDVPTASSISSRPRSALEAMIPASSMRGRKRKAGGAGSSKDEQRMLEEFNAFRRKLDAAVAAKAPSPARETSAQVDDVKGVSENAQMLRDGGADQTHTEDEREAPEQAPAEVAISVDAVDDEALLCDLHFIANCQSCQRWNDEEGAVAAGGDDALKDEDAGDVGWLSHKLTFEKDRLGKDLKWKEQNEKELLVIDPRDKEREIGIRGGGGRDGKGKKQREWDKGRGREDKDMRQKGK